MSARQEFSGVIPKAFGTATIPGFLIRRLTGESVTTGKSF
jgi:hypothetical protein